MRVARRLTPNLAELDANAVAGTAGVYATLRAEVNARSLSGVAVRCWPEFFTELGCAACGAMSMLGEEGCPASCEADVNGTVTSLLLQHLADAPAFLTDLVSIDAASDTGVLWHCGLAPTSMADPAVGVRGTVNSNRKLPLLFEFPLRPGRVTVARLHRRSLAGGVNGYQLAIGGGEMVQGAAQLRRRQRRDPLRLPGHDAAGAGDARRAGAPFQHRLRRCAGRVARFLPG
jgi:L-fucose isomerase-like protein